MLNAHGLVLDLGTVRENLVSLASRIARRDEQTAALLMNLADALDGGANADAWAYAEPHKLIRADQVAERVARRPVQDNLLRWLELLRNSLVLLPLVVTWVGIFAAAGAYYELIKAQPEQAQQSFIFLWQDGFGGRTPLTLQMVALTDATVLGLVFLLTLLIYVRSARVIGRRESEVRQTQREIEQTIAAAELLLAERRIPPSDKAYAEFTQQAEKLLQDLRAERARLDQLATRRETEIGNLTGFAAGLDTNTAGLLSAARSIQESNNRLTVSVEQLAAPLGQAAASQQEWSAWTQNMTQRLDAVVAHQEVAVEKLERLVNNQSTTLTALQLSTENMITALVRLEAVNAKVASAVNNLLSEQGELVYQLKQEGQTQAQLANALHESNGRLQESVNRLVDPIQVMAACQTELISVSRGTNDQLNALCRQQDKVFVKLDELVDDQRAGLAELARTGEEMTEASNQVAEAARTLALEQARTA